MLVGRHLGQAPAYCSPDRLTLRPVTGSELAKKNERTTQPTNKQTRRIAIPPGGGNNNNSNINIK